MAALIVRGCLRIDCIAPAKYEFESGGNSYVIWAWKGDNLNWGAGGEIGIYMQPGPLDKAGRVWFSNPFMADMPKTSTSLTGADGQQIISYAPSVAHEWTGSWNQNKKHAEARQLTLSATVQFPSADMFDDFQKSRPSNLWTFSTDGSNTATLNWEAGGRTG